MREGMGQPGQRLFDCHCHSMDYGEMGRVEKKIGFYSCYKVQCAYSFSKSTKKVFIMKGG